MYPQLLDEITIPWLDIEPFTLPFKGFTRAAYPKVLVLALADKDHSYTCSLFSIHSGIRTSDRYIEKDLFLKCFLS